MNDNEIMMYADSEMGVSSADQVAALSKALLAPSTYTELYTTPGGAITMQSLEGMLVNVTLNMIDFTLWQDIYKNKAYSTVEEYDQKIGHGISDGGFVGQMENPEFRDPDVLKQVATAKFLREGWNVGDVAELTQTIVNQRTMAQQSAMIRLLRNLNRALYTGNSTMIPKSIDGLTATIAGQSTDQVKDLRGASVTMDILNLMGQLITEGNGHVENSKIYVSPAGIQNLSTIIESQAATYNNMKVMDMGKNNVTIGGRINEIMTAFGPMTPRMDKILGLEFENKQVPQYYNNTTGLWVEGATSDKSPSTPSIVLTNSASETGSLFAATGTRPSAVKYSYRVVARNAYGRSAACAAVESTSVVATGGGVSIAITPAPGDSGSKLPSCFEIYSTKVGGSGVYRYMHTVAAAANPLDAVTYVDINTYIPGTARMYIVDQTTQGENRVLAFSQLLPIYNKDLAVLGAYSQGLINLYGMPKYYKPQVLVEIRNIGIDTGYSNRFNTI